MRFTELICRVAAARFESTARLGVRLSPISLSAEEAGELAELAAERLGPGCHIAIAAPGAGERDGERLCVSQGEHAAERATHWRNAVDTAAGERVFYVSVDLQGRAGGLTDTLEAITEPALVSTLRAWLSSSPEGVPGELASALASSQLLARQSARAICAFLQEVQRGRDDKERFTYAGAALPMLGLVRDSSLSDAIAVRLKANADLVRSAATGERWGTKALSSHAKKARERIAEVIVDTSGSGQVEERLAAVDLGELDTGALRAPNKSPAKPRKKAPKAPTKAKPAKKAKATKGHGKRKPSLEPQPEPGPASAETPTTDAAPTKLLPDPTKLGLWTEAMQRREFGTATATLTEPLASVLLRALRAPLGAIHLVIPRGPISSFLARPARRTLELEPRALDLDEVALPALSNAVAAWQAARDAFLAPILGAHRPVALLGRLVRAPLLALSAPDVRDLAERLVTSAERAGAMALEQAEPDIARALLTADTVAFRTARGEDALTLLLPTHPLWLGQLLWRYREASSREDLDATAKRLVVRGLGARLVAPARWPIEESRWLERGADVEGLLAFGARAPVASDEALSALGAALLEQVLQLTPHARAGARVVIEGPRSEPVADGISRHALEEARASSAPLAALALYHRGEPLADTDTSLLLTQHPVPESGAPLDAVAPHLLVRLAEPSADHEEGRAVSLAGVDGASATLRLQAVAAGLDPSAEAPAYAPRVDARAVLSGVRGDKATWLAVVGPRVAPQPPRGAALLLHEAVGDAEVAVFSRDLRSLAKHLLPTYLKLGVQNQEAKSLLRVTRRLAQVSPRGVLSLTRSSDALIASQLLLGALATDLGDDATLCPLVGADHATFAGAPEGEGDLTGALALGLSVSGGKLRAVVGYAALTVPLDHEVSGAVLAGELGERLTRCGQAIQLAGGGREQGGDYARSLLLDLMATAPDDSPAVLALRAREPLEVVVSGLVVAPPATALGQVSAQLKLRGVGPVAVRALDARELERIVRG